MVAMHCLALATVVGGVTAVMVVVVVAAWVGLFQSLMTLFET